MRFLTNLILFCALSAVHGQANEPPLSEAEAIEILRAKREAKAASELARKQRILGTEAESETIVDKGSHSMILRRVGWKDLQPKPVAEKKEPTQSVSFDEIIPSDSKHSLISVGSTVYDEKFTEVTWREPGVSGAKPFTIWMNRNLKYITVINHFDLNGVNYSYIGFVSSVDTNHFITHPVTGERIRPYDIPDWIPTEDDFPGDEASYLVLVEDESVVVPELLYEQMDALLIYYVDNKADLISAHERAETMRRASKLLDEIEPEKKEDIVINYWPIQSNAEL